MNKIIVAVDPGNKISGVVVLYNGKIHQADNLDNDKVMRLITDCNDFGDEIIVLIEDIKPYSLKMGQSVIETIKYIGELEYCLKTAKIGFKSITRNEVKKWIYDTFPQICVPRIDKKIEYLTKLKESKGEKGLRSANGDLRKSSFVFVDDRVIIAAMKDYWSIPTPKPGKTNQYGLSAHAWQALATASKYIQEGITT